MPMKHRDYAREYELKKRRNESGTGHNSADAKRKRARRAYIKKHGDLPADVHIDHKKPIKHGGGNGAANLRPRDAKSNCRQGGKMGNAKQKGIRKP